MEVIMNKKLKVQRTTINTSVRPIEFSDIPHKYFGEIRIGFDHNTATRQSAYYTALLNSRGLVTPKLLEDPNYLNAKDRFVRFYLNSRNEDGAPLFDLRDAIRMARNAYEYYLDMVNTDALLLALMYYTEFDGSPSEEYITYNVVQQIADENFLPQIAKTAAAIQFFKIEGKVAFIREALATDPEFQTRLNAEVERLWSIMSGEADAETLEEVDSVTGFHGNTANANVLMENDTDN
jgi:hypothetical protein